MSLIDWQNKGWLVAHTTNGAELRNLLDIADRDLRDCRNADISPDWRLNIAYNAALSCARAALAAAGFRPGRDAHHFRAIQSLRLTIKWDDKTVNRLDAFRKKRNISDYDMAGAVSDGEAEEMIEIAVKLREEVEDWLLANAREIMQQSG